MSNSVSFIASDIRIESRSSGEMSVELEVSDQEFNSMLEYFTEKNAVEYFGAKELLMHMSDEDIKEYMKDAGLVEKWENNWEDKEW